MEAIAILFFSVSHQPITNGDVGAIDIVVGEGKIVTSDAHELLDYAEANVPELMVASIRASRSSTGGRRSRAACPSAGLGAKLQFAGHSRRRILSSR